MTRHCAAPTLAIALLAACAGDPGQALVQRPHHDADGQPVAGAVQVSAGATAADFLGRLCGADDSQLLVANSTDHEVSGGCTVEKVETHPDGRTVTTTTTVNLSIVNSAAGAQARAFEAQAQERNAWAGIAAQLLHAALSGASPGG